MVLARRTGMRKATTDAARPTPAPMSSAVRKPVSVGSAVPPKSIVMWARIMPMIAAATDEPIERMRALKLLAAAVSSCGTADMMRAGIAP